MRQAPRRAAPTGGGEGLAAADVGAAGAGYQFAVLVAEVVLDDYEGHVPRAARFSVDVSDAGGAGQNVTRADGQEGFDPLAGHVDGAIELKVKISGFVEADKGGDKGGRGDDIAVRARGGGFFVDKERVGLSDGAGETEYHLSGDGVGSLEVVSAYYLSVELKAVLGCWSGGFHRVGVSQSWALISWTTRSPDWTAPLVNPALV